MRKNYTYECNIPETRNDLIDLINSNKPVIVIPNTLLLQVADECNKDMKKQKNGDNIASIGITGGLLGLLFASNPIGWLIGGGLALTTGVIKQLKTSLKSYKKYSGIDNNNNQILVLINKQIDLKYDKINYPSNVKSIFLKKEIKKIKI